MRSQHIARPALAEAWPATAVSFKARSMVIDNSSKRSDTLALPRSAREIPGQTMGARLINSPRQTKIGHVEAFPVPSHAIASQKCDVQQRFLPCPRSVRQCMHLLNMRLTLLRWPVTQARLAGSGTRPDGSACRHSPELWSTGGSACSAHAHGLASPSVAARCQARLSRVASANALACPEPVRA